MENEMNGETLQERVDERREEMAETSVRNATFERLRDESFRDAKNAMAFYKTIMSAFK